MNLFEQTPHKVWHNIELDPSLGVSIKGCGFNLNVSADAAVLVDMILNQKPLLYLELEGNTLGVEAAKELGKALESKSEIVAALWKDLFTGRLKSEIPQALGFLLGGVDLSGARLTCLDLSDNAIGPVGMPGLAPFFKSRSSFSLKELIFNNNGWGPDGGSMLAEALLGCYRKSLEEGGQVFQLKTFICGRSRIENKAAIALSSFFKEIKSLEEIHMPQNGIYTPGINALTDSFRENQNLKVLNLNDNTISPEGCIKLSECIRSLVHLKDLNLGDCLIKSEGIHHLSGPLSECINLEKINLESNEIEDEGGLKIANVLCKLPKLTEVNLCGNELMSRTADDVHKIFKGSSSRPKILVDAEDSDNSLWNAEEENETFEDKGGNESSTLSNTQTDDDDVRKFLNDTTEANFNKLLPDPVQRLSNYLDAIVETSSDETMAMLCVNAAFAVNCYEHLATEECFASLLERAIEDPFFATYILSRLGLIPTEDPVDLVIDRIPTKTMLSLQEFVRTHKFSNATLTSLHLFLQMFLRRYNSNTNETKTHIKNLFETVDSKLFG